MPCISQFLNRGPLHDVGVRDRIRGCTLAARGQNVANETRLDHPSRSGRVLARFSLLPAFKDDMSSTSPVDQYGNKSGGGSGYGSGQSDSAKSPLSMSLGFLKNLTEKKSTRGLLPPRRMSRHMLKAAQSMDKHQKEGGRSRIASRR